MSPEYGVFMGQIVGLKIAEKLIEIAAETIDATDKEIEWVKLSNSIPIRGQISIMSQILREKGAQIPSDVKPKEWLTIQQIEELIANSQRQIVENHTRTVSEMDKLQEVTGQVFGEDLAIRQRDLNERFYQAVVMCTAKDVANSLYERKLKLV